LHEIAERLNLHGTFQQMYLPKEVISVSEKDFETNMQLIEGFESLDEIDAVYHNMNVE
jgi:transcriptional/translational regulatory protein YebC/TACO1